MKDSNLVTKFIPAPTNEYTVGRAGGKLNKICIHHAAAFSISTLDNIITSSSRIVTTHYGVSGSEVHQYVRESNAAWHATNWECNKTSIGIETINSTGRVNGRDSDPGSWLVSNDTLNTLIRLVADIAKRNNLGKLVPGKNLVWHSMYYATFCPGNYLRSKMQYIADEANKINNPEPSYTVYVVKPGDYLSKIAAKFNTTWQKIYADNKKSIDDNAKRNGVKKDFYNFLSKGQELKIYK